MTGELRSRLKGAERDQRDVASIKEGLKPFGYALAREATDVCKSWQARKLPSAAPTT